MFYRAVVPYFRPPTAVIRCCTPSRNVVGQNPSTTLYQAESYGQLMIAGYKIFTRLAVQTRIAHRARLYPTRCASLTGEQGFAPGRCAWTSHREGLLGDKWTGGTMNLRADDPIGGCRASRLDRIIPRADRPGRSSVFVDSVGVLRDSVLSVRTVVLDTLSVAVAAGACASFFRRFADLFQVLP